MNDKAIVFIENRPIRIEYERENDQRWMASAEGVNDVIWTCAYGRTRLQAKWNALKAIRAGLRSMLKI
jgi:hypothetical protein